jgi:hypothetical protein
MKFRANVIFKNLKLIDAEIRIKRIIEREGKFYGLIGVAQSEKTANNGSFLYDFMVGPAKNNDTMSIWRLVKDKFNKDNTKFNTDEEIPDEEIVAVLDKIVTQETIVPADEKQLERIEKLVKPKKPRKKKIDAKQDI